MTSAGRNANDQLRPASSGWLSRAIAPIIDLLSLGGYFLILPRCIACLREPHWSNLLIIGAGYLLLCLGVILARLLERAEADEESADKETRELAGGCAGALSIFYSLFVAAMLIDAGGVFRGETLWLERLEAVGWWGTLLVSLGVLTAFVLLGLFPFVTLYRPRPRIRSGTAAHALARLASIAMINTMVLVTAAYWEAQGEGEPLDMAWGGKLLLFVVVYVVFLLFYAPPRLALIAVQGGRWSLVSFALLLAVLVWRLLY